MASGNWSSSLLKKEEEYKRMNAELESKTAHLVREAETLLKQNDSQLSSSFHKQGNLLDNINPDDIIDSDEEERNRGNQSRARQISAGSARQSSAKHKRTGSSAKQKKVDRDDCDIDDEAARAIVADFQKDLAGRMAELEEAMPAVADADADAVVEDDVLPTAAQEMSAEAQMRFLRAKVRVSEEEIGRLQEENRKLQEENRKLTQKAKEADEERHKASRSAQTLQTQLEKYRRSSEESAAKAEAVEKQLTAVRREADQLKRQEKQQSAGAQAAEVRLNRALEEVEKHKSELAKWRSAKKDASDGEKKRADTLAQENKKLERQKNELIAGFRKQMKLIDILKRQRMHLEAAKMLQFAEEEFVKALDWEKGS